MSSGTTTVTVAATDASGNTRTQAYEVDGASSSSTLTYDANGNLTAQGSKTYDWDATDRLVTVKDGATELARFAYDGFGRRAQKVAGGVTRSYVYDGEDILEERISGGATSRHVHGPGIDQPLATVDGSGSPAARALWASRTRYERIRGLPSDAEAMRKMSVLCTASPSFAATILGLPAR